MKVKFTIKQIKEILEKMKFDIKKYKFTLADIKTGMYVELEHGTENTITNITNDDPVLTLKIALAHLMEHHNYYEKLLKAKL